MAERDVPRAGDPHGAPLVVAAHIDQRDAAVRERLAQIRRPDLRDRPDRPPGRRPGVDRRLANTPAMRSRPISARSRTARSIDAGPCGRSTSRMSLVYGNSHPAHVVKLVVERNVDRPRDVSDRELGGRPRVDDDGAAAERGVERAEAKRRRPPEALRGSAGRRDSPASSRRSTSAAPAGRRARAARTPLRRGRGTPS